MPPLPGATKGKHKNRDARRSRSRNTTPSSVISATAPSPPTHTPFLNLETSKLLVAQHPQYADILDQLEAKPSQLDPKRLQEIIEQLKSLSDAAEKRVESCERAVRVIHEQMRDIEFEQRERERQAEQARKSKKTKEDSKLQKAKKRKERPGSVDGVDIKKETQDEPIKIKNRALGTPGPVDSPSPSKKTKLSPATSSLSDVADSPEEKPPEVKKSPAPTDVTMSEDEEPVRKAPVIPQQGFFPDPMAPDPTVYDIEDLTPDMPDAERKRIYSVAAYPTKDLSDQIAGKPPDKDFSNAKPTNQVAATTFLAYAEPFLRPLLEEDIAFLRERGDRHTPLHIPARGKHHYQDLWDEEDGVISDAKERASLTQPHGNLDQMNDDMASSDQLSTGPLASRLLSLLKFEHRSDEDPMSNGLDLDADASAMDFESFGLGDTTEKAPPSATNVPDPAASKNSQRLDYVSSEERIKAELRHLGLLGQDDNPDFDAHLDDDLSERLRLLQNELKRVMAVNGARKARLLDLAKERLAYQEYSTIHEDLDGQVQQAYLKRTRTLGKAKKGGPGAKPKPGHIAALAGGLGINRARDIGDSARMLMDRRKRWESCIGPVFKDMKRGVPGADASIWDPKSMEPYIKAETEALEEEEVG